MTDWIVEESDAVMGEDEALELFQRTSAGLIEKDRHVHMRRFKQGGETVGVVIIGIGEAAKMLDPFVVDEVPPLTGR